MLSIAVVLGESFDEENNEFVQDIFTLELEHSLVSLSKWESKFEKPFLSMQDKTTEEMLWYVQAMTKTPEFPPDIFSRLSEKNVAEIDEYINAKHSATWFSNQEARGASQEIITEEIIRYWMIALQIPVEYETWHLNKLFTMIKVANDKNAPKKKMSRAEQIAQQRRLNTERQAQYNTTG